LIKNEAARALPVSGTRRVPEAERLRCPSHPVFGKGGSFLVQTIGASATAPPVARPLNQHRSEEQFMTTTISTDEHIATLINVFTVEPDSQQKLVDLLDEATTQVIRHRPGFISANIHASLDGTRVVNYAQWRTRDDLENMLADPAAGEHMKAITALAAADPHLYKVTATHHP
jgi:Antibiotic biosynthesis monooxygenase